MDLSHVSPDIQTRYAGLFLSGDLIKRCYNITRNIDYGKSLDRKNSALTISSSCSGGSPVANSSSFNSPVTSINTARNAEGKFLKKLTDAEKDYLCRNDRCFNCRKIKVGHRATRCPDKEKEKLKEVKKESVNALAVVESESNSEYFSPPKSVPTIKIATHVEGAALPSSLADCSTIINAISEDKVAKHAIPTCPMPRMQIHEPVNLNGTCVDRKVVSKVAIPKENWESQQLAEFVVALLKEHEAILGMPFHATEGILVDPVLLKVILPTAHHEEDSTEGPTE